ncbi:MAG: homocysteine S-methyltransferase family protein [Ignavibacteriales bacterium]|nr:homocysteine S-methyltransferase family protein [Ignavibacteriales bacterium]
MRLNNFNILSWAKKIGRPLILDGAMGSLLQQKGFLSNDPLWASLANVEHPEAVRRIHKEYIDSGADIITTNTFRTNPAAVSKSKKSFTPQNLVEASVQIAKEVKGNLPILMAGSNAPAEDCYQIERTIPILELQENHQQHISLLKEFGGDFILNETQSHFDEIKIICEICSKNQIDFILSLFFTNDFKLLSGEDIFSTIEFITTYKPLAIGFNCITPKIFLQIVDKIPDNINWGFYLNCGSGNYEDEQIVCGVNELEYLEVVKKLLPFKPSFVGSCCGSNPNHTKLIKNYFDELRGN